MFWLGFVAGTMSGAFLGITIIALVINSKE